MQLSTSRRQCIKGSDAKVSLSILQAPGWLTDLRQVAVRSEHPTGTAPHCAKGWQLVTQIMTR